jgi:putative CocE/NonD family hydrolase
MVNLVEGFGTELGVETSFAHDFHVETQRIPLRDGVELAARMWMPDDALKTPAPAIIEYIPYRQRDYTAARDGLIHPWFAGNGYASIRVDMRGSGDSDGIPMDEYVEQEQLDALDVLAYLSAQPWCTGATGMMGISWGGFNALQVAARRPPSLKAIVTVCSTDDRYTDDVHYPGGCLVSDNLTWGTLGFANMGRAPDPAVIGRRWREMWLERLENAPFPLAQWLSHQTRDAYWKHGSVIEDYRAIDCAVFAIGGWADSYTNAIPRLMKGLSAPRRALIGPWVHAYPHLATPAPRVGFLQQATQWWDRWLKGDKNGIDREPMFSTFVQDSAPPQAQYGHRTGRWIEHDVWPPSSTVDKRLFALGPNLRGSSNQSETRLVRSPLTTGVNAGEWMALGAGPEMALDQNVEDAGALTFETEPFEDELVFVGAPKVRLTVRANGPSAMLSVRISELFTDGRAARLTYGVLNLTHRDSHETPTALTPGDTYVVDIPMNDFAHAVRPGNRLRLSITTSQWPMFWPAADGAGVKVFPAACTVTLPVCENPVEKVVPLELAAIPTPPAIGWSRPVEHRRCIELDRRTNRTTLSYHRDEGAFCIDEHNMQIDSKGVEQHSVVEGQPASAVGHVKWRLALARDEWQTAVECEVTQTATATDFLLAMRLEAYEGETRVFTRSESRRIPRNLL